MEAELRAKELPALPSPKTAAVKKFYWPEDAADELGLVGYRVLYTRMEALGMIERSGRRLVPAQGNEKYVKLRKVGTKMGSKYHRIVLSLAGMDYLREKLAA